MKTILEVPRLNANDDDVEIVFWYADDRSAVAENEDIVDFETSKAAVTIKSESAGFLRCLQPVKERVRVGEPYAAIYSSLEELDADLQQPDAPSAAETSGGGVRITKRARELMERHNLSAEIFAGAGMITAEMVEARASELTPGACRLRREPLGVLKKAESTALCSHRDTPRSSVTIQFNTTDLRACLRQLGLFGGEPLPLFLHAVAAAAAADPRLCSYYEDGHVVFYDRVDLGIAIDLGKGLKVAAIRNANTLSAEALYTELEVLSQRYMENSLTMEDLQDSSITVSDLSSFDVMFFEPLLNARQSVILGIGGDSEQPGWPMTITAAFDHRIVNGREVALMLQTVKSAALAMPSSPKTRETDSRIDEPDMLTAASCDSCAVGLEEYYSKYGRSALMAVYLRPDGSQGCLCHLCADGYV